MLLCEQSLWCATVASSRSQLSRVVRRWREYRIGPGGFYDESPRFRSSTFPHLRAGPEAPTAGRGRRALSSRSRSAACGGPMVERAGRSGARRAAPRGVVAGKGRRVFGLPHGRNWSNCCRVGVASCDRQEDSGPPARVASGDEFAACSAARRCNAHREHGRHLCRDFCHIRADATAAANRHPRHERRATESTI
jgi:hypothetical protein